MTSRLGRARQLGITEELVEEERSALGGWVK
jgi:hypothetical protein